MHICSIAISTLNHVNSLRKRCQPFSNISPHHAEYCFVYHLLQPFSFFIRSTLSVFTSRAETVKILIGWLLGSQLIWIYTVFNTGYILINMVKVERTTRQWLSWAIQTNSIAPVLRSWYVLNNQRHSQHPSKI